MSFCQNHRNHHCVHAHKCENRDHRKVSDLRKVGKNNKSHELQTAQNRDKYGLQKITQVIQQQNHCEFNSRIALSKQNVCSKCLNRKDVEGQLQGLKKQNADLKRVLRKVQEDKKQYQGIIDYYRRELERALKCSSEDIKIQIKRHLKENAELTVTNRSYASKILQLEKLLEKNEKENQDLHKNETKLRKQKEQLSEQCSSLSKKFKRVKNSDSNKIQFLEKEGKDKQSRNQRSKMIIQELTANNQRLKREVDKLKEQHISLEEKNQILKQKMINEGKVSNMELDSLKEREKMLKGKISEDKQKNTEMEKKVSQLKLRLKLKQEQVIMANKVVEKQLRIIKENKQLYEKMKNSQGDVSVKKQVQQSERDERDEREEEQNQSEEEDEKGKKEKMYIKNLQEQVNILREKIKEIERKGEAETIQEYILKVGASQAFKRIVEEKNETIKKLIREKGALLLKVQ